MNSNDQKKIKILLTVCNNVLNGTERYVVDLAKHLDRDRFDVTVATPAAGPLSEILAHNNIKEVIFDNGRLSKYSLKGLKNLAGIIRKSKYDILHANAGFLPCIIAKIYRVKFIIEVKHGIFYSLKQLESLNLLRKFYERSKQYFVHKFIATSPNDKELMMKYFRIPENRIDVIYLGLDVDALTKNINKSGYRKIESKEFIIGHIGRLTYQKAQITLLKALKLILKKYPDVMLVIIGDGEDKEQLKSYIDAEDISRNVTFKGYIKDVFNEMMNFDVHVLTSRFEGMGYVNLEAMELGVPVITSNVGGASNFLTDGYDALITEVDNENSTAHAIERLISDPEFRKNMAANARRTVKDYSIERMVRETSQFYLKNLVN